MNSANEKTQTSGSASEEKTFIAQDWTITTNRSHILNSKCSAPIVCNQTRSKLDKPSTSGQGPASGNLATATSPIIQNNEAIKEDKLITIEKCRKTFEQLKETKLKIFYDQNLCWFCKFDLILEMSHFPDMTYAQNFLRLHHQPSGLVIEFNALDALIPVLVKSLGLPQGMKVSPSEAWLQARMDCEYTKNVMNADFDWTFSTDYPGSFRIAVYNDKDGSRLKFEDLFDDNQLIESTEQRIDMKKLMVKNRINFFEEIDLFEDELADHGVAKCSVKIRVMDDSFYVLLRFFLRVDRVFVRFFDTRIYHEFGQPHLLRERSMHQSTITDLKLLETRSQFILTDPQELFAHVPRESLQVDQIRLPSEKMFKKTTNNRNNNKLI